MKYYGKTIFYFGYPADTPKNSGYTELKVFGVYFSPPQAGEKYTTLNYPFVYRIFSWCAKGIVIFFIFLVYNSVLSYNICYQICRKRLISYLLECE